VRPIYFVSLELYILYRKDFLSYSDFLDIILFRFVSGAGYLRNIDKPLLADGDWWIDDIFFKLVKA